MGDVSVHVFRFSFRIWFFFVRWARINDTLTHLHNVEVTGDGKENKWWNGEKEYENCIIQATNPCQMNHIDMNWFQLRKG